MGWSSWDSDVIQKQKERKFGKSKSTIRSTFSTFVHALFVRSEILDSNTFQFSLTLLKFSQKNQPLWQCKKKKHNNTKEKRKRSDLRRSSPFPTHHQAAREFLLLGLFPSFSTPTATYLLDIPVFLFVCYFHLHLL